MAYCRVITAPTTGINWRRAENKNNSASGYGVLICKISI
nr:MAG TPA: hypothetical protein [Caudoviricetes sp.]